MAQRSKDLGSILMGDKATVTWRLENQGQADLVIERTRTSCGCTVVHLSDEDKTIPPGGFLDLNVQFDSTGRRGPQNKTIKVYSNDPAEPVLTLEFHATVDLLYDIKPPTLMNLRGVRRGAKIRETINLTPGPGHKNLKILSLSTPENSPLLLSHEPFKGGGITGERVHMAVSDTAALGPLITAVNLTLRVDELERTHEVPIRGEVLGDLTWRPREVGVTRHTTRRGRRLTPVTVRSTESIPFEILGADAGPLFDVVVEARDQKRDEYAVILTLRNDAPSGPFGTMLTVRTSLLDQPLVHVPVFGIVAEPITVDPPIILLRQDGTPRGTRRRVKLMVPFDSALDVSSVTCPLPAIEAKLDRDDASTHPHIRFLRVSLIGQLPPGQHDTEVTLTTNVIGAQRLDIPVSITVADDNR